MAKKYVYLISILLIMASLYSISYGLVLDNLNLGQGEINGVVRCDLNGDSTAPPISGATVTLRCGDSNTTLAEAVTNPAGLFKITVNILETFLVTPSRCALRVNLPAGNCRLSIPDGVLTATFTLVDVIQTNTTSILVFVAGQFKSMIF